MGSGTEITLNIKGKADSAEIERLKALMEQLAPVLANAFSGVAPAADEAAAAMGRVAAEGEGAGGGGEKAATGMAKLLSTLGPAGPVIAGVVAGLTAGAVALTAFGATAIAMGKDSSAAFATLANRTGETGAALDGLKESLRHVSAGSAAGMGDIASAMGALGSRTELTGAALETMTKQQLALAKVTGTDVAQNITNTTRMFGDWSIATDQQSAKMDELFRASQQSGVGVDRLSQLVVQFGAPLRNLGVDYEMAISMMGKFEKEGVNTELVMSGLRASQARFAKAGMDMETGIRMGIKGIQDAKDPTEALTRSMELFGAKAGPDLVDTIRAGKFELDDMIGKVRDGTSTISGAADNMAGMSGQFAKMKNAFVSAVSPMTDLAFDLATKVVGSVVPALTSLSTSLGDKLAPMADWAREKIMPLVEMIGPILKLAAESLIGAVSDIIGIFGDLGSSAGESVGGMDGAKGMMMSVGAVIVTLAGGVKSLTGFLREHAPTWDQVKTAAEVIAPVIAGIGIALLTMAVPGLIAAASAAVAFVTPIIAAALPVIALGAAIGLVVGLIITHWDEVKAATLAMVDSLVSSWSSIITFVGGAVDTVTNWVVSAWQSCSDFVINIVQGIADFLASAWTWIKDTVVGLVGGLLHWLVSGWQAFYAWIVGLVNRIALAFHKGWTWIGTTVSTLIKGLVDWMVKGWNSLLTWFNWFFNTLGGGFAKAWAWIKKTVGDIVGPIIEWLVKSWHAAGKFLGSLWDTIGEATARAWSAIKETFKGVAMPILNGMAGMFGRIAELARDGMQAAGDVIGGALGKIAEAFGTFFAALGLTDIGAKFAGVMSTVKGVMSSISSSIGSAVDRMKGGLGGIADLFGDKVSAAREKVAGLFSGSPGSILEKMTGGDSSGAMGLNMAGQGLEMGALKQGGEGGGGKGPLEVGDTGADGMGEFYIADDGSKVYTSGAGLARQDAKEKKRQDKEAERAAKKAASASKAKGGAGGDSADKDRAKAAGDLAKDMSDVAQKVADAVQAGLDAMASLRDADIPGRDIWGPRLEALQEFVAAGIQHFQEMGKGLLTSVGKADDGATLLDEANAKMAESAADVGGSMIDTITKTASFLTSIVKAKLPDQDKIDQVFTMTTVLLARVQAGAIELGRSLGPLDDKGENPAAKALSLAGQALGVWVDLTMKMADGVVALGARAKDLAAAPAALTAVQGMLAQVDAMGRGVTDALRAAIPDDLEREDMLSLSRSAAGAMAAWVGVIVQLGSGAESLRKIAFIPDIKAPVKRFFDMIAELGGAIILGLQTAIPNAGRRDDAIDLSRSVAATLAAWIVPVANLAAAAMNLRRVAVIPEDAPAIIGHFWKGITAVAGEIYMLMSKAPVEDQLQSLTVSKALSEAIGASVSLVSSTAAALRTLADVPDLPPGLMPKIQATLSAAWSMLSGLLPPDAKTDAKGVAEQFALTRAFIDGLNGMLGLVANVAALGKTLADMVPVRVNDVAQALANAGMVRDWVVKAAEAYTYALEQAKILWEDLQEKVGVYAATLQSALGAFQAAAGLKLGEILPIRLEDVQAALANASLVEEKTRGMMDAWYAVLATAGRKAAEVAQQAKDFAAYIKDTLGTAAAAASFRVAEVLPLDVGALLIAMDNAKIAAAMVDDYAREWLGTLALAKRKTADVLQAVKDYSAYVKDALGAAAAAAGFAIAEIEVLDPAKLEIAMQNAGKVAGSLQAWAEAWIDWIRNQGRKLEDVIAEGKAYAEYVKAAMEAVGAGAELATDAPALDASGLARIMANVGMVVTAFGDAAKDWAARLIAGGRDLDVVATEAKDYGVVVGAAAEALGKVSDLFKHLAEKPPSRAQGDAVAVLIAYITMMVQDLASAYSVIEQEAGSLKRAGDLAAVVSPAAEAIGKTLDALSLDKLLKTPLVDTKIRSGFAAGVAARRMAYLGEQIAAGIQRTVKALVDGLKGISVPDGIETGLDRLAGAYERIISVLERINDLASPDPAKIRQLAALAAMMVAALAAEGFPTSGSGAGAGQSVERPGELTPPPAAAEELLPGLGRAGIGGGRRPVVPEPPPGSGTGTANVTLNITQPVVLDGEVISTAIETVIARRNLKTTIAPSGTG